jgi:hypothetical protein
MTKLTNRLVNKFSEFETKYEVEEAHLETFNTILQESTRHFEVHHVHGSDEFYTKGNTWKRFRISEGNQELTTKRLIDGSITHRIETNLNVTLTDEDVVRKDLELDGYNYDFSLFKESIIYNFADACVCFYKVKSKNHKRPRYFVEIEVYNNIRGLDEKKAYRIIKKYETLLLGIGVTEQDRLNSSLYEMYRGGSHDKLAKIA